MRSKWHRLAFNSASSGSDSPGQVQKTSHVLKSSKTNQLSLPVIPRVRGNSQDSRFLDLPQEIRDEIYSYVPSLASIHINSIKAGQDLEFDAQGPRNHEQYTFFQPPCASGFLRVSTNPPPTTLLLVSHQIREEVEDMFFGTATFEVAPLTPNSDEWRLDPTYQKLRKSPHLSRIRKIRVRVALERMGMRASTYSVREGLQFVELSLEECVGKLQALAEMLIRVLRTGAKSLKMITLDWKDEFSEEMDWYLKSSILFPFSNLKGVDIRLGEVIATGKAREVLVQKLEGALEGLSA